MEIETSEPESESRLLLLEVMKYLEVQDLCQLSLVSSSMYVLCSTPKLWSKAQIKKIKFKNGLLEDFFNIRKFNAKKFDFLMSIFTKKNRDFR